MEGKEIQEKVNDLITLANTHTVGMTSLELFAYRTMCERAFLSARKPIEEVQ